MLIARKYDTLILAYIPAFTNSQLEELPSYRTRNNRPFAPAMNYKYHTVDCIFDLHDLVGLSSDGRIDTTDGVFRGHVLKFDTILADYQHLETVAIHWHRIIEERPRESKQNIKMVSASPGFTMNYAVVGPRPPSYSRVGQKGLDVLRCIGVHQYHVSVKAPCRAASHSDSVEHPIGMIWTLADDRSNQDYEYTFWGRRAVMRSLLDAWSSSLGLLAQFNERYGLSPSAPPFLDERDWRMRELRRHLSGLRACVVKTKTLEHDTRKDAILHMDELFRALQDVSDVPLVVLESRHAALAKCSASHNARAEVGGHSLAGLEKTDQLAVVSMSTQYDEDKIQEHDTGIEDLTDNDVDTEIVGIFITKGEKMLVEKQYEPAEENFRAALPLMDSDFTNPELNQLKIGVTLHLCHSLVSQQKIYETIRHLNLLLWNRPPPRVNGKERRDEFPVAFSRRHSRLSRGQLVRAAYLAGTAYVRHDYLAEAEENALIARKHARDLYSREDETSVYCVSLLIHVYDLTDRSVEPEAYRELLPQESSALPMTTESGQVNATLPVPILDKPNGQSRCLTPATSNQEDCDEARNEWAVNRISIRCCECRE